MQALMRRPREQARLKNGIQDASNTAGQLAGAAQQVANYVKNNGQVTVNTEVSVAAFNDNSNAIAQLRALKTEENAQAIEISSASWRLRSRCR